MKTKNLQPRAANFFANFPVGQTPDMAAKTGLSPRRPQFVVTVIREKHFLLKK